MIKHIVVWKLKDDSDKEINAHKMKALLESCSNIVPGLMKLEVGMASSTLETTCDVILYSEFTDKAALDAYQIHPTHAAIKPFIRTVTAARECMDYEI